MRRSLIISALVAAFIVAGFSVTAGVTGIVQHQSDQREISQLQAQHKSDQQAIAAWQTQISSIESEQQSLSTQMGKLNVPSDPLANYDEVCTIFADSVLGNALPWYLPCTTSAETIPQPG